MGLPGYFANIVQSTSAKFFFIREQPSPYSSASNVLLLRQKG
jgi:hypothetical protein